MRIRILTLLLMAAVMSLAQARTSTDISGPTNTEAVFDGRYRKNPNATETLIQGEALRDYRLSVYRGITLTDMPDAADEIEPLLIKDGPAAREREVSYKGGRLYYAFYQMPDITENIYIFYINQHLDGGNKITLIYLKGKASREDIQRML